VLAAEALRLQHLFDDAGLSVLFLKGASLAALAYNNLALRSAKDIDLLVSPETIPAATALMSRAGYRRFDPPPDVTDAQLRLLMTLRRDLSFINEHTGLQVELHWQLFLNPYAMDQTSVMAASRLVPLAGSTGLRTLGEEDLFTYLCVHGALHWWNQLKWLADVGALIGAAPEDDAMRFKHAAEARGAGRAATYAMSLSRRLLDVPLPTSLITAAGKSYQMRWLEETALRTMTIGYGEQEPGQVRFGTTRGSLSTLLLGQGWRYRLTELRNLLANESDVLAVPLPARLRFLYPILRLPFWAWRQAIRR
jgi:hypothetical protein